MKLQHKIALSLLAAVISLPAAFAQDPGQGPGSDAGPGMHRRGPGGNGPGWGQDGEKAGWGRDGHGGPGRGGWQGHQGHGRGMGMRGRGGEGFMLGRIVNNPELRQKIGVTDEQAAKIRGQMASFRKTEIRNHADIEVKRVELRDLFSAEHPDRAAIDQKLEEISAVRLNQEKSAVDFHLSMKDALTPDQRAKLKELFQSRRQHGPGGPNPNANPNRGAGPGGPRGNANRPPARSNTPPPPNSPPQSDN